MELSVEQDKKALETMMNRCGVSEKHRECLQKAGVTTLSELAYADCEILMKKSGLCSLTARGLKYLAHQELVKQRE
jgi:predicted RecB family nuclease